jgi:sugar phosphate isomerase/epimerase
MPLRFAYNTNGAANHRLDDALSLIADSGYDGVALTIDHHHFDPFAPDLERRAEGLAKRLRDLGLGFVIETGARYLLDPRVKHEPTLLNPSAEGRARRIDFLTRCIRIAAICDAEAVSFWAGVPQPGVDPVTAWNWLVDGVVQVTNAAAASGITMALEPEPGMLIETVDDFEHLSRSLSERTSWPIRLTLDTGHCLVTGERDPAAAVREFADSLGTVAIEDMRRGVHEHLPFGQGDMDIPSVLQALEAIGFDRLVCVELSRESHRAHLAIPESLAWLKACEPAAPSLPIRRRA